MNPTIEAGTRAHSFTAPLSEVDPEIAAVIQNEKNRQESTLEMIASENFVPFSILDTRLVMRPLRNTERVLTNDAVERLLEKEKALGADLKFEDIIEEVAGVYPRIMMEGDMDAGAWSCGMVAGLIHDIPTCQELVDRIMGEAEAIISKRMGGMLGAA